MFHSRTNEKKLQNYRSQGKSSVRKGLLAFKAHLLPIKPVLQENHKEKNLHTILHVITQFQKLRQFEYLQLLSTCYGRTHLTLIYINKSSHFTDGNQEEKNCLSK